MGVVRLRWVCCEEWENPGIKIWVGICEVFEEDFLRVDKCCEQVAGFDLFYCAGMIIEVIVASGA